MIVAGLIEQHFFGFSFGELKSFFRS